MVLICPICGEQLDNQGRSYVCPNRHSFDVARQGYVNLLPVQQKHSQNPGDTREQVLSRRSFLEADFYAPIARALINMPDILFADEPTGNLDRNNADEVLKLLLKTREEMGQTLIMVTHDLSIADHADRIFRMDNGILTLQRDYIGGTKKTVTSY